MPFTKDLIIATTVLVGCCLVLFLTLAEPDRGADGTVTVPGGPELARGGDEPTPPPPDQPPTPPAQDDGGRYADAGGSGMDFGAFDQPLEEQDEAPLVSDLGPAPRGGSAGSPGSRPGASGGGSPFSDPALFDDRPVTTPAGPAGGSRPGGTPVAAVDTGPERQPSARPAPDRRGRDDDRGTHTVAKGETLMDISYRHYGTHHKWQQIAAANDVDPDALVVGTVLTIPTLADVVPASAQGTVRGGNTYVVKKGDSYYTIARDLLGDSSRFLELVKLNDIDPYELMPGDVIKVPSGARVPTTGAASPSIAAGRERTLPPGARWHTVEKYEVLGDISQQYYGTSRRWREIAEANGISDPASLKAGVRIIIPAAGGGTAASGGDARAATLAASAVRETGGMYTIQQGDLLETIARDRLGDAGRWKEIQELNPGLNPRKLKVGERIVLPAGARGGSPSPAPAPTRREPVRDTTPRGDGGAITWPELDDVPPRNAGGNGGGTSSSPFDRIVP